MRILMEMALETLNKVLTHVVSRRGMWTIMKMQMIRAMTF